MGPSIILICQREGTTARSLAGPGHRDSEQELGPGGLTNSLPSPPLTPSEPGLGPLGPAQARPHYEEGPSSLRGGQS